MDNWMERTILELEVASYIKDPVVRCAVLTGKYSINRLVKLRNEYKTGDRNEK